MDVPVTITTLQVKAFARSPFDNQLFWFRVTFLKSHHLQNFRHYGNQNGHNLEGCIKGKIQAEKSKSKISVYLPGHVTAVELYTLCLYKIMKNTVVKTRLVQITT